MVLQEHEQRIRWIHEYTERNKTPTLESLAQASFESLDDLLLQLQFTGNANLVRYPNGQSMTGNELAERICYVLGELKGNNSAELLAHLKHLAPYVPRELRAQVENLIQKEHPLFLLIQEGCSEIVDVSNGAVIGRDPRAHIQLYDEHISAKHLRIFPGTEAYMIEDLGSKNGTKLNGVPLASHVPKALHRADIVTIGRDLPAKVATYCYQFHRKAVIGF